MIPSTPIEIVAAWQGAANAQDDDRLVALSHPNIEVVGPRGSGYGQQLLREWLARAGLTLTTERVFARDERVVLARRGVWRALETGAVTGERELASLFQVTDGRVAKFARFDTLDVALEAAGLAPSDEVPPARPYRRHPCRPPTSP